MPVVADLAVEPLMSREPAMLVRLLIETLEELFMSEVMRCGMTEGEFLARVKGEFPKVGHGESKERAIDHAAQAALAMKRTVGGCDVERVVGLSDGTTFMFHGGDSVFLTRKEIALAGNVEAVAELAIERRAAKHAKAKRSFVLPPCNEMTLTELERYYADWHGKKYGRRDPAPYCPNGVILPASYAKLLEEVGELGEALMKEDKDAVAIEAADVIGILFNLVRGVGRSLPAAITAKLDVLYKRLDDDAGNRGPIEVPMYGGNLPTPDLGGAHV